MFPRLPLFPRLPPVHQWPLFPQSPSPTSVTVTAISHHHSSSDSMHKRASATPNAKTCPGEPHRRERPLVQRAEADAAAGRSKLQYVPLLVFHGSRLHAPRRALSLPQSEGLTGSASARPRCVRSENKLNSGSHPYLNFKKIRNSRLTASLQLMHLLSAVDESGRVLGFIMKPDHQGRKALIEQVG
jgi:hypothetical protein